MKGKKEGKNSVTPSGCWKVSLVFSGTAGSGQAEIMELFPAGLGSVIFTMATMATLRLTQRPKDIANPRNIRKARLRRVEQHRGGTVHTEYREPFQCFV